MGRKTWDSIPASKKPLKNRLNVVLTQDPEKLVEQMNEQMVDQETVSVFSDFKKALESLSSDEGVGEIFVIGGTSLFDMSYGKNAEFKNHCKLIMATRINKEFECDVFSRDLEKDNSDFPPIHVSQTYSQGDITFDYCLFGNAELLSARPELVPTRLIEKFPKHPELQYLEIIDDVIKTGKFKQDRTGTGIYTKFGA